MRLEMFLNELSLAPEAHDVGTAQARAEQFVKTMTTAVNNGVGRTLHVPADFHSIPLAPGYFWRNWQSDGRVGLEVRQYFRSLSTKAPFLRDQPDTQAASAGIDCYWGDRKALGLRAAYVADGLAFSLLTEGCWDSASVECGIQEIVADEVDERRESIHHASQPEHVQLHSAWIMQRLQSTVASGQELWRQTRSFFPLLEFCAAVEGQMGRLPTGALASITRGLFHLNKYCANWASGAFNAGALECSASPESTSTLAELAAERTFLCPDGQHRTFSWHVKAGHWRIYFDPGPTPGQILVGYTGRHLRTVDFG